MSMPKKRLLDQVRDLLRFSRRTEKAYLLHPLPINVVDDARLL